MTDAPPSRLGATTGERRRGAPSPLAVLLVALLVAAVVAGGWVAWLYWGTVQQAGPHAAAAVTALRERWQSMPTPTVEPGATPEPQLVPTPAPGEAQWVVRIPALGGTEWPLVAGTSADDLEAGIGWYPGTAQPGQVGNCAVAGLRITHAQPFRRLLDLDVGDEVVLESRDAIFTYVLTSAPRDLTVQAGDSWVLDPVPGQAEVEPSQALLTLITSEDLIPTPDRTVAFAVLKTTELK